MRGREPLNTHDMRPVMPDKRNSSAGKNQPSLSFTAFIVTVVAVSSVIGIAMIHLYRNPAAGQRVQAAVDTFTAFAGGTALIGLGVFLLRAGFSTMGTRRLMGDTPRSKIRAMAMGLVEVSGIVKASATLVAPLSGKRCVYYKITGEQYETSDNDSGWKEFYSDIRHERFSLKDATGTAAIDPEGAMVHTGMTGILYQKHSAASRHGASLLERIRLCEGVRAVGDPREFEAEVLRDERGFVGSGDRRYREYCIEPGQYLYILGTATPGKQGAVIRKGPAGSDYHISAYSESSLSASMGTGTLLCFIFSAITLITGILVLAGAITGRLR